jgi:hypothetical protein
MDDCHISGSFLGCACIQLQGGGSVILRRSTVQVGLRCMRGALHVSQHVTFFWKANLKPDILGMDYWIVVMIVYPEHPTSCSVVALSQNLCRDMSVAKLVHQAVGMLGPDDMDAGVEMEDCLLETMTGSGAFIVRPAAGGSVPC